MNTTTKNLDELQRHCAGGSQSQKVAYNMILLGECRVLDCKKKKKNSIKEFFGSNRIFLNPDYAVDYISVCINIDRTLH